MITIDELSSIRDLSNTEANAVVGGELEIYDDGSRLYYTRIEIRPGRYLDHIISIDTDGYSKELFIDSAFPGKSGHISAGLGDGDGSVELA
jgi:hypothetical protein